MRDKRFDCSAVLTVIKTYKYIVYVEIFVTVNCGAVRDGCYHSEKIRTMDGTHSKTTPYSFGYDPHILAIILLI